jgi:putative addiction module component (TIGR02574 family)
LVISWEGEEMTMARTLEEARKIISELSPEDREILYLDLSSEIDRETTEHEKAWQKEIERRVEEVKSGTAVLYDGDEVMAEVRALIDEKI